MRIDPVRFATRGVLPPLILLAWGGRLLDDAAQPFSSGSDTFFHLRFGHEFLSGHWSLWHPGHVTTFETARWVPTQWLPEVLMAATQDAFGLPGVAWLLGLLSLILVLTWYLVARRHSEAITAALLSSAAAIAAYPSISMRPQVLSFIATTITTEVWLSAARSGRRPWWLIPLVWVWAMCHGMWPVGIAIGLATVIGISIDQGWRVGCRHLAVPMLQAVAAAVTPVGPLLYPAVLRVNGNRRYFSEWAPPDFTQPSSFVALLVVALVFVLLARSRREDAVSLTLAVSALGAVVYSDRTVPVAVAMLVPLAARLLGSLPEPHRDRKLEYTGVVGVGALGLVILAIVVPHTAARPSVQPAWLDPTLSSLSAGTPVLNDSFLGGYILWAYPNLDPYEHGYGDVYTQGELNRIETVNDAKPGWVTAVRASRARFAVEQTSSTIAEALELQGWRVVRRGDGWDFLAAPTTWAASAAPPVR